jgi:hypothetical protein
MKVLRLSLILFLTVLSATVSAQKIHVKANNEPLSAVIKRLKLEVSYDNRALQVYRVTIDKSFSSPYKALLYLISDKPLQVKNVAGVYVITAKEKVKKTKPHKQAVKTTYVVRKIPDPHPIDLDVSLKEIVITAQDHTPSLTAEVSSGINRFNSFAAKAMPGSSDNMIFNVLRMMPGIRASGEPTDELYVWGSSPGESRMTYDGIPLFTMQSYNSNISYINPYMLSEVRYKRGVLSADEGSQTGALVNVVSDMSSLRRPVVKAMISTMSMNIYAAMPIGERWAAAVAYRHTLESIFGGTSFDAYRGKKEENHEKSGQSTESTSTETTSTDNSTSTTSTTVTPDYKFQDINVNVSGKNEAGNTSYKFTLYGAKDYVGLNLNDTLPMNNSQTSYQGGASANVAKVWADSSRSELSAFCSALYSKQSGISVSHEQTMEFSNIERVSQLNVRLCQTGIGKMRWLSVGGELNAYKVNGSDVKQTLVEPTIFANAKYKISHLNIDGGLRTDLMSCGVKWQPRLTLSYQLPWHLTLTSSWGIYYQYLVKNPIAFHESSYRFAWDINTSLHSQNFVAGIAYDRDGFNVSAEAYLKKISNSQWVKDDVLSTYDFRLRGIDFSTKYNWRHGLIYSSMSIADDPRQTDGTSVEMKAGGILRFYPFTFSANYIFGNGYNSMLLPVSSTNKHDGDETESHDNSTTYSRLDVSASYEKRFRLFGICTGVSIINVFDTDNKKCTTSWTPHDMSSSLYTQASRFTPIIFIEFKF